MILARVTEDAELYRNEGDLGVAVKKGAVVRLVDLDGYPQSSLREGMVAVMTKNKHGDFILTNLKGEKNDEGASKVGMVSSRKLCMLTPGKKPAPEKESVEVAKKPDPTPAKTEEQIKVAKIEPKPAPPPKAPIPVATTPVPKPVEVKPVQTVWEFKFLPNRWSETSNGWQWHNVPDGEYLPEISGSYIQYFTDSRPDKPFVFDARGAGWPPSYKQLLPLPAQPFCGIIADGGVRVTYIGEGERIKVSGGRVGFNINIPQDSAEFGSPQMHFVRNAGEGFQIKLVKVG